MTTFPRFVRVSGLIAGTLLALVSSVASSVPAPASPFIGRWALTLPGGGAGWLEITAQPGWYDGTILWGGGSVLPLANVTVGGDTLTVTRNREVERKDAQGKVVRVQQLTETLTAHAAGDELQLKRRAPRADGSGFEETAFAGRRIPALPAPPNLAQVKFGPAVPLLAGKDLAGWRLIEAGAANGWTLTDGVLSNRPEKPTGTSHARYGNLRTEQEFEDFKLTLEVRVPPKSNSGIYLRGIYEVQVFDSYGLPLDSHNMGAIYSRIVPSVAAEKPSGEWQKLEITLVTRHVTVVLNGTTIIANQPLLGCTGGALTADEAKPGPLYLQGDHGPVDYRSIVIQPALR